MRKEKLFQSEDFMKFLKTILENIGYTRIYTKRRKKEDFADVKRHRFKMSQIKPALMKAKWDAVAEFNFETKSDLVLITEPQQVKEYTQKLKQDYKPTRIVYMVGGRYKPLGVDFEIYVYRPEKGVRRAYIKVLEGTPAES
jgi:hypothetical protein